ncbi:MAG: FAD:protein FMN transferase [Anaeromyxobacter sp.]
MRRAAVPHLYTLALPAGPRPRALEPSAPLRRARPALGTLVELGYRPGAGRAGAAEAALGAAWRAIAEVERALSRFDPASELSRFNAAPAGAVLPIGADAATVLRAAAHLQRESGGLFDVSLGTGPRAWAVEAAPRGDHLIKRTSEVRLDLGGIAKGHAVDRAFEVLSAHAGPDGACWVNAGGDLRVRGACLPVELRDEQGGGTWPWLVLEDGALATSHLAPGARSALAGGPPVAPWVSVLAPRGLWADALTKVVAATGEAEHPLLVALGACAWIHGAR